MVGCQSSRFNQNKPFSGSVSTLMSSLAEFHSYRSVRLGEEKNKFIFLFPSSHALRLCRAPHKISRSPCLAHKAPFMQAITYHTRLLS